MTYKVGNLEIFENKLGDIAIHDKTTDWGLVAFDECMAEKLCKCIMAVAKEMREVENV